MAACIKAHEIGCVVPCEFNLYASSSSLQNVGLSKEEQQVMHMFSLNMMLPHLNPLLQNLGKHCCPQHRLCVPKTKLNHHHHHHHATLIPTKRGINSVTHLMLRCFVAHCSQWRRGKIKSLLPCHHQTHCKLCQHFGDLVAGKPQ